MDRFSDEPSACLSTKIEGNDTGIFPSNSISRDIFSESHIVHVRLHTFVNKLSRNKIEEEMHPSPSL